ncbi:DUF4335 domain-containing protein [Anabaena sp. FACHB-1237]|uniref:DUF4335 domain-containing protein n=1 Tax=Anabaena sp. FACHB-1237 TaxID=2692769 RepID=UPI0016813BF3|nr:DUF4335 domain-containing protein [Anabaena sp. FACHB-1237]MBD2137962.1 DUF4335 domain-containing protein [Anabaena sp. FACHB-1237]
MNIQRKYSLPNCTLLLEGFTDVTKNVNYQEFRPELSILVNAECYLSSYTQPISGGREFFESLVRAVSGYAQEVFSNVPNPQAHNEDSGIVQLQQLDSNKHRLIIHGEITPTNNQSNAEAISEIAIDLNTVQLFDLVEAIDQFFADSQTLPELSLELHPVIRNYGGTSELLMKQAVPFTVGLSTLAVAAFAFTLVPPPKIQHQNVQEDQSSTKNTAVTPTNTPTTSENPKIEDLEALIKTVPQITDRNKIEELRRRVYNQIDPVWKNRSEVTEDIVYRLGVSADGSIVGYKAINQKANDLVNQTPLPSLLYNPVNRVANEPLAQFKVVFKKEGVLDVSSWGEYNTQNSNQNSNKPIREKIKDAILVKELQEKLSQSIRQNWSARPTFDKDLKYRVAVNKDGVISFYEPLHQDAFKYLADVPLKHMLSPANTPTGNNKEPLAHFKVVFSPKGDLEVTNWNGGD